MARAKPTKFDLDAWVKTSTEASGVPEKVQDTEALEKVARLVVPRLASRSAAKKDQTGTSAR